MDFLRDPIWQSLGVLISIILAGIPFIYQLIKRRKKSKRPDIDFVVTDHSCTFGIRIGNNLPKNDVFIDDGFHLDISGHFDILINNPEFADAYIHIQSIKTNWE